MKKLLLLLTGILLISCDKEYTFIETVERERGLSGKIEQVNKDPFIFKSKNDTLAYMRAYQKYCIAKAVEIQMEAERGSVSSKTLSFKVFDGKKTDITNIAFKTKKQYEENTYEELVEKTKSKYIKSEQHQFFIDNDLKYEKDLPEDDFQLLKKSYEIGIFKDKSFCQFYKEYKVLEFQNKYKESDKVISSFKKVDGLEMFFAVNGYKLCPEELQEAKAGKYTSEPKQTYYPADNVCIMSKDFIKKDLYNPSTVSFSSFDCTVEKQSDGSYTVLRKVGAKNALGVKKEYIYKLRIAFLGGNDVDIKNWKLIGIISEEYK